MLKPSWLPFTIMAVFGGLFLLMALFPLFAFPEATAPAYTLQTGVFAFLAMLAFAVGSLLQAQNARIEQLERKLAAAR